jgi:hypothetical protein
VPQFPKFTRKGIVARLDAGLLDIDKRISNRLAKGLESIKVRFEFLDRRMDMIKRIEAKRQRATQGNYFEFLPLYEN